MGSDGVKDTEGKSKASINPKVCAVIKTSKMRVCDLWPVNTLLFYTVHLLHD